MKTESYVINLPDIDPPTVTSFAIPATTAALTIPITTFTAADNVGVTGYILTESAVAPLAGDSGWTATAPANYTFSSSGSKTLYAWARDAAGNVSAQSASASATTQSVPDTTAPVCGNGVKETGETCDDGNNVSGDGCSSTCIVEDITAPSVPTGLTAAAVSSSQIDLTWNASTDSSGIVAYNIYRDGGTTLVGSTASTSYSDTGLSDSTTYSYAVRAFDLSGNISNASSSASATTQSVPDTTAPSAPTGLTATAVSSTQINLSWSASTDNVAVTGYKIYRGGALVTSLPSPVTSYSDTGLSASTAYSYTISAYDAAGNESGQSNSTQAATQALTSEIIPAERRINWSPGIPGGIPENYTRVDCPAATGNGTTDDLAAINACLSGTTAGNYVYLPAGTYRTTGTINIPSGVVLRGAGPSLTIINVDAGATGIQMGNSVGDAVGSFKTIPARGATSVDINWVSGRENWVAAGDLIILRERTFIAYGTHTGANGASTLTDSTKTWTANAWQGKGYIVKNAKQNGNTEESSGTVTDNGANTVTATLSGTGVWNTGDRYYIYPAGSPYWSHDYGYLGIASDAITAGQEAQLFKVVSVIDIDATSSTVNLDKPVYVTYSNDLVPQMLQTATGYGGRWTTTNSGIEDLKVVLLQYGAGASNIAISGAAYSWIKNIETYNTVRYHVRIDTSLGVEIRDSYFHNQIANDYSSNSGYGVAFYNNNSDALVENNIFDYVRHAVTFSNGGLGSVVAYNYVNRVFGDNAQTNKTLGEAMLTHGTQPIHILFEGNMVGGMGLDNVWGGSKYITIFRNYASKYGLDWSGSPFLYGLIAFQVNAHNYYTNFVGNVMGRPGDTGDSLSVGCNDYYGCPWTDPNVSATILRHGNYDYVSGTVQWDAGTSDHNIPNSLYLNSKPSFFGNNDPWPPIGPDVSGYAVNIPAKDRFSIVSDTTAPSVPTGLTATAASSTQIDLIWSAATDNVGVAGYKIYRNGSLLTTTYNLSPATYSDTGLSASTSYSFTVSALDAAGNESGQSAAVAATTLAVTGAENIYIAQSASGSNSGADCANAHSVTWFNTSGNWANSKQSGKIGPGDTAHLCGIISTNLTAQASGSDGAPITVLFESGAKLSKAAWGDFGNSAIYSSNKNYIIIDGGVNGVIEATDNGTAFANQQQSTGVSLYTCNYCEVSNLTVRGMYQRTPDSGDANNYGNGIKFSGGNNNIIHHNTIIDANNGIYYTAPGSSSTINIKIYNNTISRFSNGIIFGSGYTNAIGDNVEIYNNDISDGFVWDGIFTGCTGDCWFHNDGIQVWAVHSGSSITNLKVYNNYIHGDLGEHITAWIFTEGYISGQQIYNNILTAISGSSPTNGFIYIKGYSTDSISGSNAKIYNNTIVSHGGAIGVDLGNAKNADIKNNIFYDTSTGIFVTSAVGLGSSNNNIFYSLSNNQMYYVTGFYTFANWQSQLGFDQNSSTGDPLFVNISGYDFHAQNNSPTKDVGTTLALFTTDKDGIFRPQGSAWDIGAYEYVGSTAPVCGNGVLETGEACDDGNNVSGDGCSSTCIVEDITAPSVSSSQIDLTWTASTDASGVVAYNIYRNGGTIPVASSASTSYSDTGLAASTAYSYTVRAFDLSGNESGASSSASAATLNDTTAPTVPTGLTATADIIPVEKRTDWSPGIAGGIPTSYTLCANVKNAPYNAVGDDITDDTTAFVNALAACPSGTYVYVPAGTYKITSGLTIPSGLMLKGDGPSLSKLRDHQTAGTGAYLLQIAGWSSSQVSNITAGWNKDSTSIAVDSTAGLAVNDYIMLSQLNETGLVTATGYGSSCTWCGPRGDESRAVAQIVKITNIAGNDLTLSRPIYYASPGYAPQVMKLGSSLRYNSGIQDLYLERVNTIGSGYKIIVIKFCINCWVKNIESYKTGGAHIRMEYDYGCEIRDSYFHEAWGYGSGAGYGVLMINANSDNLIENNIFNLTRHSVVMEGGGSGNVIAYNYSKDPHDSDSPTWLSGDMITHGAHPYMNLFEGNFAANFENDNTWGSSSHNTYLRNHANRSRSLTTTLAQRAIDVQANNHYMNFVGNVLGPTTGGGTEGPGTACGIQPIDWRAFGCNTPSGTENPPTDSTVLPTILRHGNYSYASGNTQWDSGISNYNIPVSYYLSSRPAFFGDKPWPLFGPDVVGIIAGTLPAEDRFQAGQ